MTKIYEVSKGRFVLTEAGVLRSSKIKVNGEWLSLDVFEERFGPAAANELRRSVLVMAKKNGIQNGDKVLIDTTPRADGPQAPTTTEAPSLVTLAEIADYLPIGVRKKIRAAVGDYGAEIEAFCAAGKYKQARWSHKLAWGCAIWYLFRGLWEEVGDLVTKALKGN